MDDHVDYSSSDDDDHKVEGSSIKAVQRLGNSPQKQLSALRRLLGTRGLLHHIDEDVKTKAKERYKFISTCLSCLGNAFNSLPGINLPSTGPITASVPFLPLFLIWLLHDQAAFQGPCPLNLYSTSALRHVWRILAFFLT